MKFKVKKMYNGKVEVRDYQLNECLEKNSDMVIEYDGEIMTIPFAELKTKAVSESRLFESKILGNEGYCLIGYEWNPDEPELKFNLNKIEINKEPSFYEIWHEGKITHDGKEHLFWLIHPKGVDMNGNEYEIDVRWFFARVPREVRALIPQIIDAFKSKAQDNL